MVWKKRGKLPPLCIPSLSILDSLRHHANPAGPGKFDLYPYPAIPVQSMLPLGIEEPTNNTYGVLHSFISNNDPYSQVWLNAKAAMIAMMIEQHYLVFLYTTAILFLLSFVKNWWTPGVRTVPGPFLAKLSNLYRLLDVSTGQNHISLLQLHDTYGENVRIGPNVVSIRNPKDVAKVYGIKGGYAKVCQLNCSASIVHELKKTRASFTRSSSSWQMGGVLKLYSPHLMNHGMRRSSDRWRVLIQ